jgi:RNA polymerase sigma-70 factor (family 1)
MNDEVNHDLFLLERLKKGDVTCFEVLYSKYSGRLYNFVLNLSKGDCYLAEEIVQNVFVKIWEIHPHIRTEGSFNSFLFTVGRNMFLNVVKSRVQESLYHDYLIENEIVLDNSVEKEVEFKMLEEQINKLIDQLPPARRNVYILSKVKHLSNKEIAALLDISENTVESQLNKATHFIRQQLTPYCEMVVVALLVFYAS